MSQSVSALSPINLHMLIAYSVPHVSIKLRRQLLLCQKIDSATNCANIETAFFFLLLSFTNIFFHESYTKKLKINDKYISYQIFINKDIVLTYFNRLLPFK